MKKLLILLLLSSCFLAGCASKHMVVIPASEPPVVATPDDAVVIFMRPSAFGGGIQSSVFDVSSPKNEFIGIVSAKTKVGYATPPGKKLFMVIGENADFMHADLEAGKTYFALVSPRMGIFKARFSLHPISAAELNTNKFLEWDSECKYVKNLPSAELWANDNADSIQSKRQSYYTKWIANPPADQPTLSPQDGRESQF